MGDPTSRKVRLAEFVVIAVPRLLHVLLSLIFIPLLYDFWGEEYSLYVTAFALVGFAQIIGEPLHLIYYEAHESIKRNAFLVFLVVLLLLYLVILAPMIFAYGLFIDAEMQTILSFAMLPLFSAAQQFSKSCMIYHGKISGAALIEVTGLLVKFPFSYFLILQGVFTSVQAYLVFFCLVSLLETAISSVLIRSTANQILGTQHKISLKFLFERIHMFGTLALLTALVALIGSIDRLWIAKTEHPDSLIIYSFALSVAALFHIIPGQINMLYQPVYFQINESHGQVKLMVRQFRDIALISILSFIAFFFVGDFLLNFWLGHVLLESDIGEVMSLALFLIIGVILNLMFVPVQQILIARSQQLLIVAIQAATVVLLLVALVFATYQSALINFAIVVALTYGVRFVLALFVFKSQIWSS